MEDTWELTEEALRGANLVLKELFRIEPPPLKYVGDPPQIKKGTPPEDIAVRKMWEAQMKLLRAWFVQIHERRIRLNVRGVKKAELHFYIMKTDLAELIRLAANIREESFDRAGAAKCQLENIALPKAMLDKLDYTSFYQKSLHQSCMEAEASYSQFQGLGEVAYMLLSQNWNQALDWANRALDTTQTSQSA